MSQIIFIFFDLDGFGLKITRELGGTPLIRLIPNIPLLDEVIKLLVDQEIIHAKLFYKEESEITGLMSKLSDNGFEDILVHTPSKYQILNSVFKLASHYNIQLIMGHGCYSSRALVKSVRDYGFLVDTSNNSLESIIF